MKSSLIFGFIFLIIGGTLAYIQYTDSTETILTSTLIIGILLGTGIGLVFGSIMGYTSKAQSIKRKNIKQQELEAKNKASETSTISDTSTKF